MAQTDSKNSSGQEHPQTAQTVPYPAPYPQQFEDDTIDLYELWLTLWNRKWLVIAVTVVAALGSIVYALLQPPVYKVEAFMLPPTVKDIQALNIPGAEGISVITPAGVFDEFKKNLSSRTLQKKFILENNLMELLAPERTPETRDEDIYAGFAELFELGTVNGSTSLSIELHDAEIAAEWVNDLINFFDTETISRLVANTRNTIANRIRDIEYTISSKRQMVKLRREDQIDELEYSIASKRQIAKKRREDQIDELEYSIASKRQMAKQRREDKIEEIEYSIASKRQMAKQRKDDLIKSYEEAAKTAKSLGIMTGFTQQTKLVEPISGIVKSTTQNGVKTDSSPIAQMNVDIATATTPLFFIGYDALDAELDNLKSRTDDDPFIPGLRDLQENLNRLRSIRSDDPFIDGLRDLQEELALLNSIQIEEEGLSAVNIDQAAFPPKHRIKPNRRLIVSLGAVVGLFSGIFLAFFIAAELHTYQ